VKRIIQMASLSLVALPAASSYAQEPPAAPPPGEAAPPPVTTPAAQAPAASTALGGGMLLGADVRLAVPLSNFSNVASLGIGALARFEYILTPQVNLTGRIGFTYFLPKSVNGIDLHYWTIPILVGAKFAVIPNLYVAGEIGLYNNHFTTEVPFFGTVSGSETDFGLTLGAGYRMGDLDFRASLEFLDVGNAGDSMSLVVSAGYNFWKK